MSKRATYAVLIRNRITEALEREIGAGLSRQEAEAAWDGARRRMDVAQVVVIVNELTGRAVKRQSGLAVQP